MKVCEFEMSVPKSHINNVIYEVSKYVESYDGTVKHLVYGNNIHFKIKVEDKYDYAIRNLIKQLNDYVNQLSAAEDAFIKDAKFYGRLWACVAVCAIIIIISIKVIEFL